MRQGQRRRLGIGIALTIGIASMVWVCDASGLFTNTDYLFYDWCQRAKSVSQHDRASILLVYVDRDTLESPEDDLINLIDEIYEHGPRKIGIVAPLSQRTAGKLRNQDYVKDLIISSQILPTTGYNESIDFLFDQVSESSPNHQLITADTSLDVFGQPVYRSHWSTREETGKVKTSFASQIAESVLLNNVQLPAGDFGIQFRGPPGSLPHVDANVIRDGGLVSELVSAKIVLIGLKPEPGMVGLVTPTTTRRQLMTQLELHGNILHTLIQESWIQSIQGYSRFLLLLLFGFVGCQVYRKSYDAWILWFTGAGIIAALTVCWICINFYSFWLPVTAICSLQLVGCLEVLHRRLLTSNGALRRWDLLKTYNERSTSTPFTEIKDPWPTIADTLYQMFYPTRVVLMELAPGSTHLKVVKTVHCKETDILEKRRDFQRIPYHTAISAGKPCRVAQRKFFKGKTPEDQVEFLVPFMFGTEVTGFMVLGIAKSSLENWPNFDDYLGRFANEVAALLADHRAALRESDAEEKFSRRLARLPEDQAIIRIERRELAQSRRVAQLENAFELSETAAAICDMFGRIIKINSKMLNLLQRKGFVAADASCVDIINALTGRKLDTCRKLLREVSIDQLEEEVLLPTSEDSKLPAKMFLRPILIDDDHGGDGLSSRGVFLEVIDGGIFDQLFQWQDRLTEEICESANRQLSQLKSRTIECRADSEDIESFEQLFSSMSETVDDVMTALENCHSLCSLRLTEDPKDWLPVDTAVVFQNAMKKYDARVDERRIEVRSTVPLDLSDAVANPLLLERVFFTILELLRDNAYDQSHLTVEVEDQEVQVQYRFQNRGFGTPTQDLRDSLSGELQSNEETINSDNASGSESRPDAWNDATSEQFNRLSEAQRWLELWNGRMKIESKTGEGISVELVLSTELGTSILPDDLRGRSGSATTRNPQNIK